MTLVLTLVSQRAIFQASDFRLTFDHGTEDTSFKSLQVCGPFAYGKGWDWTAFISYAGVGSVQGTDTSQWLFDLLRNKVSRMSLSEAINAIQLAWPRFVRPLRVTNRRSDFIVGAFEGTQSRVIVLSNYLQISQRSAIGVEYLPQPTTNLSISESASDFGKIYVIGSGSIHIQDQATDLARLFRRLPNDRHGDNAVFEELARIMRVCARRATASRDNSVSEGCWTHVIRPFSPGSGRIFGLTGSDYFPPQICSPIIDSVNAKQIIEELQSKTLLPQAEQRRQFTRARVAEFSDIQNLNKKQDIIRRSAAVGALTFNSHDVFGIEQIKMEPPLQGNIRAETSNAAVAVVAPSESAFEGTGCTPSGFDVSRVGPGSCTVTFQDSRQSLELKATVYASSRRAYIANRDSSDVSVIDTEQHAVIKRIPVRSNPTAVAIHPSGNYVYIAQDVNRPNQGPGSVAIVDTTLNRVVDNVVVGIAPSALCINQAGTLLYVGNLFSGDISVIDIEGAKIVDWIELGGLPVHLQLHPLGFKLYVVDGHGNQIVEVDTLNNNITSLIKVGEHPCYASINRSGSHLYVANQGSNDVSIVDLGAKGVAKAVPVRRSPKCVAVSWSARRVYATNVDSATLSEIDTFSGQVCASIPTGASPFGVCVDPSDKFIYVVNADSNDVTVIALDTHKLIATIPVGLHPVTLGNFLH